MAIRGRLSREAGVVVHDVALLDLGRFICGEHDKFARQRHSQIQLRSCLPHTISQSGKQIVHSLEKFSLKSSTKTLSCG